MTGLVLLLNLLVWGAHAVMPFHLVQAPEPKRRAWAVAALPALGLSVVATAAALHLHPDPAVAWGLHELFRGSKPALALAIAGATLACADGLTALGWRQYEPAAWRALGVLGLLGLAAATYAAELVRIGWGPVPPFEALVLAAALRLPLALAAGELFAGGPRFAAPLAALGLPAAAALWPAALRAALAGDRPTLWAASLLLALARFVPVRLRRATLALGLAMAALWLARAGQLSDGLGQIERIPHPGLLAP